MPAVGFPSFEQLQVLTAVADFGSFSAAARQLGRAQSVISYAVAQLEAELGLELFDRAGRFPRLTEAGRSLLEDARRASAAVATLRARAAGLQNGVEAELKVCADVMMPTEWLVGALEGVHRDIPAGQPAAQHRGAWRRRPTRPRRPLRSRHQHRTADPARGAAVASDRQHPADSRRRAGSCPGTAEARTSTSERYKMPPRSS